MQFEDSANLACLNQSTSHRNISSCDFQGCPSYPVHVSHKPSSQWVQTENLPITSVYTVVECFGALILSFLFSYSSSPGSETAGGAWGFFPFVGRPVFLCVLHGCGSLLGEHLLKHSYWEKFTITTSSLWVFVTCTVAGAQIVFYIWKNEYLFTRDSGRENRERIWKNQSEFSILFILHYWTEHLFETAWKWHEYDCF